MLSSIGSMPKFTAINTYLYIEPTQFSILGHMIGVTIDNGLSKAIGQRF
jgi:hypothetical protein